METIRLGLEWFLNPDHVPFLVGLERGWFEEAGIDLTLVEPSEHLDAFDAIDAGQLELAVTEPIHLVEDLAKGRPVRGFARFLHTNGGVMYLESSGIQRPRDMADARVQYPGAPGAGGLAMVRTMVEADGGEVGTLTPVNHGFRHTDALVEGQADVAVLAFYNFEVVEARHRGHPARFFALKDWGVPDFCQLILVGQPSWLDAHRSVVERFLRVVQRGLDLLHQAPDEVRATYFRRTGSELADPLMNAIFDATVPCFTFDLTMSRDYYRALAGWMHRTGLLERPVDPDAGWSNDLALGLR